MRRLLIALCVLATVVRETIAPRIEMVTAMAQAYEGPFADLARMIAAQVSEIAVHPTDTNIIYVSGSAGCARTLDGGRTWSLRLAGSSSNVKIDPQTPTTVYVARNGLGVYKSTNSGGTFARLTGGLPTGVGDVHLAMCASSPGRAW